MLPFAEQGKSYGVPAREAEPDTMISVIVPCFNEERALPVLYRALVDALAPGLD
jgi:hypothetical protein